MIAFLQGKQWVFNHPFYLLMNVAVGGNFGGAVGADTTFPQKTSIDYVRFYQARPKPVPFTASFRDNFSGWKQISIPFSAFKGSPGTSFGSFRSPINQFCRAGWCTQSGAARPGPPGVRRHHAANGGYHQQRGR